jgi:hypothetical protein
LALAKQMLSISRKCKKKNLKHEGHSNAEVAAKMTPIRHVEKNSATENDNVEFALPAEMPKTQSNPATNDFN